MDKGEKTWIAAANSARFQQQRPEYRAVDGRTYQLDREVPSPKPNIKTAAVRNRRDRPSAAAIYRIEHWLSGKGRCPGKALPADQRDCIIAEYGLTFSQRMQQYTAPEEQVWQVFLARWPDKLAAEGIHSYAELLYRATHRR